MAKFKELDLEVTPRQALREFNEAHASVAMTPSAFMPRKSTRKRKAETVLEPKAAAVSENLSVPEMMEDELSSESSSPEQTGVTRRKSARLSRTPGITLEDLDPDLDLTKPTVVPASVRPSEDTLLLDDTEDATMMVSKPF